jgi:SpoIIAA-like
MSVELHEDGKILVIKLTGKLAKEDYEQFAPEVDRLIKQHGKLRMLVQMHDFHGWTAGALWQDIKFDLKHFRQIERLALVGEKTGSMAWQRFANRLPPPPFGTSTAARPNRPRSGSTPTCWSPKDRSCQRTNGVAARELTLTCQLTLLAAAPFSFIARSAPAHERGEGIR